MSLWPGPDSAVLYYRDWTFDGTNFLDSGRFGIPMTPTGFAAPGYGIGVNGKGQRYLTFAGAQYATATAGMSPTFYANPALDELTFVLVAEFSGVVQGQHIFCCRNVAATRGLRLYHATPDRLVVGGYDATGAGWTCSDAATSILTSRRRVIVFTVNVRRQSFSVWLDGTSTITAVQAAQSVVAYDAAAPVLIGADEVAANQWIARLYHLGLWPKCFNAPEVRWVTDYWRERI